MNEVWLRLAIVIGAVAISLLIVALLRRRPSSLGSRDSGALAPGVYLFTSSTCSDCAGAQERLQTMLGSAGFIEIGWEDDPGLFTHLGIDAVPCTVVVGDDGSASLHPGMPDGALRSLNP